jgi:hypothetical protein
MDGHMETLQKLTQANPKQGAKPLCKGITSFAWTENFYIRQYLATVTFKRSKT